MTEKEQAELTAWVQAASNVQPEGTLGLFCYVRDGQVSVLTPAEMKLFPSADLPIARELIDSVLDAAWMKASGQDDDEEEDPDGDEDPTDPEPEEQPEVPYIGDGADVIEPVGTV